MQTTVLLTAQAHLDALGSMSNWADTLYLCCAWATTNEGSAPHWKLLDLEKLKRAVIGVDFAQTEPWVLNSLDALGVLKVGRSNGTYHPKVYLGVKGAKARAIVGSANFTSSAFGLNTEIGVMLAGDFKEKAFQELYKEMNAHWKAGLSIDPSWLMEYTEAWSRRPVAPSVPRIKYDITAPKSLNLEWPDYYQLLKNQEDRLPAIRVFQDGNSYMRELDNTSELFARVPRLVDMSQHERSLAMGLPGHSSGLIGSMSAARYAKEIMRDNAGAIGMFLDQIPLKGEVLPALLSQVLEGLMSLKGVKLGVVTRLLAVKRPDLFVSVNRGSSAQLALRMGQPRIATAGQYLTLLESIWALPWFRSQRPAEATESLAWDRRVALLDAVLYVHE